MIFEILKLPSVLVGNLKSMVYTHLISECRSDDDCLSTFIAEAEDWNPAVWNDDDEEGAGAEAAKVERPLVLLAFKLVPAKDPSVALGAGGRSISKTPSNI